VTEDVAVLAGLWAALHYPLAFVVAFILFCLLAVWLLPRIWRGIVLVFHKIRRVFSKDSPPSDLSGNPPPQLGNR
jgi:hypothetical protein